MTDTPPRDDPQCDHEWPTGDVAPNFLACVKCGHFETLVPRPAVFLQVVGDHLRRQGEAFSAAYCDKPTDEELRAFNAALAECRARSAYQRGMDHARGRDVPPVPVPVLPSRVDDLDSDTYDALRARYAWLEQQHRDTVHSEQGVALAGALKEHGDLKLRTAKAAQAVRAMRNHMATDARDWSLDNTGAFLYGVILGWGSDTDEPDATDEVAATHNWSEAKTNRMREHHAAIRAIDDAPEQP